MSSRATPTPEEIEDHFAWVDSLYADEEPVVITMGAGTEGRS